MPQEIQANVFDGIITPIIVIVLIVAALSLSYPLNLLAFYLVVVALTIYGMFLWLREGSKVNIAFIAFGIVIVLIPLIPILLASILVIVGQFEGV